LLRFDRTELDQAIAINETLGDAVKRKVLLNGNLSLYFCVFAVAKLVQFLGKPFKLFNALSSGRRLQV
jgi:hypothetical protein